MTIFRKVEIIIETYVIELIMLVAILIIAFIGFYVNSLNQTADNVQQVIVQNACVPASKIGSARIDHYMCDGFKLIKFGDI